MNEIWKPIKGYEGFYEVSNLGNVKSLDKFVNSRNGGKRLVKGKKLKTWVCNNYVTIGLWKNSKQHFLSVHRLVAEVFIPNPTNLPEINHKDENTLNNYVYNLEWCDRTYNNNYGKRLDKIKKALSGDKCYMYNKRWVTKGNITIQINKDELENYLNNGWHRGRK